MANSIKPDVAYLDTFSSNINFDTTLGRKAYYVESIEWIAPTTVDHTAVITDGNDIPIFSATCVTAKTNIIKYFHGRRFNNIKIASGAVGSGKIIIIFSTFIA